MKLTVLGSGTNYINKARFPSAYLIETDSEKILLECGSYSSLRLLEYGLRWYQLDRVIITHPHPDHMGDLIPSILSMWLGHLYYDGQQREKPLYIHGYPGFKKDYETLRRIMFPDRPEPYSIHISEHGNDEFEVADDIKIKTCLVPHMEQFMQTIAVRFNLANNKSLTYSGDTGYSGELIKLSKGSNLAIYEAAFTAASYHEKGSRHGHMTPQDAAKAASEAPVKKLIISHLYEGLEASQETTKVIREIYSGEVIIAQDGLQFEL